MLTPVHIQNTDIRLDQGGANEVSAAEIRSFLDDNTLDSLFDVDAPAPLDGQLLGFVGGSINAWQPINPSSFGGYGTADFLTDFAAQTTDELAEGTRLYFTDERVDDRVAALLVAGTNITIDYDDAAGTLTINSSGGGPGATALDDLTDVFVASPEDGQVLTYVGGSVDAWIAQTPSSDPGGMQSLNGLTTPDQFFQIGSLDLNISYGIVSAGVNHIFTVGWTGVLGVNRGGTGSGNSQGAMNNLSPLTTTGDIIYRDSGGNTTRLPVGSSGDYLGVSGGIPAWTGVQWSEIQGKPTEFNPSAHTHLISDITDIDLSGATDGDVLVYVGGSLDQWQPQSIGATVDLSLAVILDPTDSSRNLITNTDGDQDTLLTLRAGNVATYDLFDIQDSSSNSVFSVDSAGNIRTEGSTITFFNATFGQILATNAAGGVRTATFPNFDGEVVLALGSQTIGGEKVFANQVLGVGANTFQGWRFTTDQTSERLLTLPVSSFNATAILSQSITTVAGRLAVSTTDGGLIEFVDATSSAITDFNEAVDDRISSTLVAGTNVNLIYDDGADTLTISASGSGGAAFLDGLDDVTITSPSSSDVLVHNGVLFVNRALLLGDLEDVSVYGEDTPEDGDILKYVGGSVDTWVSAPFGRLPISISYNTDGTINLIEYDTGDVVSFGYDGEGLLQTITEDGEVRVVQYNSSGQVSGIVKI